MKLHPARIAFWIAFLRVNILPIFLLSVARYSDGIRSGRPGFYSWQGQEIFLFSTASRPALGPTQSRIQWVPGAVPQGLKQPELEADH
jgi:hypothetical protein